MRVLFLAFLISIFGVTSAEAQEWTVGPTASFGYGWSDGRFDHIGDEGSPDQPECARFPTVIQAMAYNAIAQPPLCNRPAARSPMTPFGSLGLIAVRTFTRELAATLSLDVSLGSTHRLGQWPSIENVGFTAVGPDEAARADHALSYELAYRVASTGRVRLGGARRGYLGLGARLGYRMGLGSRHVPKAAVNPDGEAPRSLPARRGFTAEALVEAGVTLGSAHPVTLGVLVGAGRPRVRAELVLSVPFAIGSN